MTTAARNIAYADALLKEAADLARSAAGCLKAAHGPEFDATARRSHALHYANGLEGLVDGTMDDVEAALSESVGRRGDELPGLGAHRQWVVWRALEHLRSEDRATMRCGWWRRRA